MGARDAVPCPVVARGCLLETDRTVRLGRRVRWCRSLQQVECVPIPVELEPRFGVPEVPDAAIAIPQDVDLPITPAP